MSTTAIGSAEHLFIGGEWVAPLDGGLVDVVNPTTEEPIAQAALGGPDGHRPRGTRSPRRLRGLGGPQRCRARGRAAARGELIEARASEFARLLTLEVGSPQRVAAAQTAACRLFLDWHADQAGTFPLGGRAARSARAGPGAPAADRVVGAIVPWNYPLGLSFPKLSPALLTGCTVVLKPPEETPLFGSLLAEVFAQAGLPPGVLNVVQAKQVRRRRHWSRTRWSTRSASRGARRRGGASPGCAASG